MLDESFFNPFDTMADAAEQQRQGQSGCFYHV